MADLPTDPERREPSGKKAARTGDWASRLSVILSVTGAAAALVAALGFPAAIVDYSRRRVPIQFLTYDRALRAGVLPAAVLVVIGGLLVAVGYALSNFVPALLRYIRSPDWSFWEDAPLPLRIVAYPPVLLLFGLFVLLWLVLFAAMLTWLIYPFVWETRTFGLGATIPTIGIVIAIDVLLLNRKLRAAARVRASTGVRAAEGHVREPSFEMPFSGLYAGLAFGGWTLAALLTLRSLTESVVRVNFVARASTSVLLTIAGVVAVTIGTLFFSGFSAPAFASTDRRKRLLARAELGLIGLLVYAGFASLYAYEWYPTVPQLVGGGRPDLVAVEVQMGSAQVDLSRLMPNARCSRTGTQWICRDAYLVDSRSDNWVMADDVSPHARTIVLPRSSVTLVQGRAR